MKTSTFVPMAAFAALAVVTTARAQGGACENLYLERNGIYKEAGYCFKTARAIREFGNAGCSYDSIDEVPLSNASRQRAAYIAQQERQLGCPR